MLPDALGELSTPSYVAAKVCVFDGTGLFMRNEGKATNNVSFKIKTRRGKK